MTSPIYELCDAYAEQVAALDPVTATFRGIVGHDAEMTDYSPDGIDSRSELDRTTLDRLRELSAENDRDRIAADLLSERLTSSLALDDAGETLRELRVLGSPFQAVRQVFDIMPRATEQDWSTVAARMELVPNGLAGVQSALEESARRGIPPARRQVLACTEQGATWAGLRQHGPFFVELVAQYAGDDPVLKDRLVNAAAAATKAYSALSHWLRHDLAPLAWLKTQWPERYGLASSQFLGAKVDPEETYNWGWDELHRLEAEMSLVAKQIVPGATVAEAIVFVDPTPPGPCTGRKRCVRSFRT